MRAGLSAVQQTLTPEAAAVVSRSMAEAARRCHGQTTPLHVAATLLVSPSGILRQACARSHPATSHPLQCRALELCFSVALDRLPSAAAAGGDEPPLSNALMAALKRAQAHQRRGCPEQQQQPLLAVKVELEHLVVSILDDPGVSRVMREASFQSPAVKATIEQSLSSSPSPSPAASRRTSLDLHSIPRLHQPPPPRPSPAAAAQGDATKVLDVLARPRKRNPVLVGDAEPEAVLREALRVLDASSARIIHLDADLSGTDRSQFASRIKDIAENVHLQLSDGSTGVVVNLGDLKWLVENPEGSAGPLAAAQQSETGRAAVAEMARLVARFAGGAGKIWLVGKASCETYLRCQVYYPSMEKDWDLQAVPIAPRARLPSFFPRLGGNGILNSSIQSPSSPSPSPSISTSNSTSTAKVLHGIGSLRRPAESNAPAQMAPLCPICSKSYEGELANVVAKGFDRSSSGSKVVEGPGPGPGRKALPPWLQIATSNVNQKPNSAQEEELKSKQGNQELLKKWHDTCARLHRRAVDAEKSPSPLLTIPRLCNPVLLPRQSPQPFLPKSDLNLNLAVSKTIPVLLPRQSAQPSLSKSDLNLNLAVSKTSPVLLPHQSPQPSLSKSDLNLNLAVSKTSPPESPVRTDLVLGGPKSSASATTKDYIKDAGSGFNPEQKKDKFAGVTDIDSFKRIFTGLTERVSWQPEAASSIATVVVQAKSGYATRRGSMPKNDTWLLFVGPDKLGKKKMTEALSELVCNKPPVTINLGRPRADADAKESGVFFRGKTVVDRVAEAVRQNPSSVIVLDQFDQADLLASSSIRTALQSGRLRDSYGRETGLGSALFVLTTDYCPDDLKCSQESLLQYEEKILATANSGSQLEISIGNRTRIIKRPAEWPCEGERPAKQWKDSSGIGLSLDLNLAAGVEDDPGECSRNSSDLTVEHEHDHGRLAIGRPGTSIFPTDIFNSVDETVVFKPVNFAPLKQRISESISTKFSGIVGNFIPLQLDDNALDRIVGGLWVSGAATKFEDWAERVLTPTILQLKSIINPDNEPVARLSLARREGHAAATRDRMPSSINIVMGEILIR